jgi:hypothetical protein
MRAILSGLSRQASSAISRRSFHTTVPALGGGTPGRWNYGEYPVLILRLIVIRDVYSYACTPLEILKSGVQEDVIAPQDKHA